MHQHLGDKAMNYIVRTNNKYDNLSVAERVNRIINGTLKVEVLDKYGKADYLPDDGNTYNYWYKKMSNCINLTKLIALKKGLDNSFCIEFKVLDVIPKICSNVLYISIEYALTEDCIHNNLDKDIQDNMTTIKNLSVVASTIYREAEIYCNKYIMEYIL
jgi:hypothetical protein